MFWSLIRKHYHPRVWEGHGRTREFFICRQMRLKLLLATAVIRIIWILGLGSCVGTRGSLGRAAAASPASPRSGWRMRTLFTRLLSAFIMNKRLRLDTGHLENMLAFLFPFYYSAVRHKSEMSDFGFLIWYTNDKILFLIANIKHWVERTVFGCESSHISRNLR